MSSFAGASDTADGFHNPARRSDRSALIVRWFGWTMLAVMTAFVLNNYLTYWHDLPGVAPIFGGVANGAVNMALSWLQMLVYAAFVVAAAAYVLRSPAVALRTDSAKMVAINSFIIRAAFFAVLIVGCVDATISFLRVEGLLDGLVGEALSSDLGRSQFRGPYLHMPLIALSVVLAAFSRSIGFIWLALLVVAAELLIVIGRFIFSYEQAFMADLVRFWYAALFLFASAYTMWDEGHVRVDVFYAAFKSRTKGYVNAIGSVFLGMSLCWTILIIGMGGKQNIINAPILSYETTQAGFGLYVKYLMAGFLGVFAVSMLIIFTAYLLEAAADIREDPGGRSMSGSAAH
ncbi:TRAP transporter small permease subunit [Stappia sp. ES.058]|uniref:TRAP transporter small permease subunit n=1 Tax=Stappia sp. ES.058 TaxID=1881061 RepID=UPI0008798D53|nr:TRAP transporter small permease subunit [Stappia sp. ES.058]SDU36455.1 Tripartite ATP-independent transporter, DctQ component [Stappia sp. ES.058]